jgi:hypothetical protein
MMPNGIIPDLSAARHPQCKSGTLQVVPCYLADELTSFNTSVVCAQFDSS